MWLSASDPRTLTPRTGSGFLFLLQPLQSWSSGASRRTSHWSSPAPFSGSSAAWGASTCTTAGPTARPPCCPWQRAASSGWTQSAGAVCSWAEGWTPCGSMWPSPTYSTATQDCTCGSWASGGRTSCPVTSSSSCWLKGKVKHHNTHTLLHFSWTKLKLSPCTGLCCREAVPVLSQLPPSAPHHLCSSRTGRAHTQLSGHRQMCEYLHFV